MSLTTTTEPPAGTARPDALPSAGPAASAASTDGFGACLAAITDALARVADRPVWSLDDGTVTARLGQALAVRAGLDELVARLVGAVEERGLPAAGGCSSTRSWLVGGQRTSVAEAARLCAQSRAVGPRA